MTVAQPPASSQTAILDALKLLTELLLVSSTTMESGKAMLSFLKAVMTETSLTAMVVLRQES